MLELFADNHRLKLRRSLGPGLPAQTDLLRRAEKRLQAGGVDIVELDLRCGRRQHRFYIHLQVFFRYQQLQRSYCSRGYAVIQNSQSGFCFELADKIQRQHISAFPFSYEDILTIDHPQQRYNFGIFRLEQRRF